MTGWDFFECFTSAVQLITLFMYLKGRLGQNKPSRIKNIASIVIMFVILFAVNAFFQNHLVAISVTFICLCIQALLLLDGDLKAKAFAILTLIAFYVGSEIFAFFCIKGFNKIDADRVLEVGVYRMTGSVISMLMLIAISRVVLSFKRKIYIDTPPLKHWITLLTIPILSSILIYIIFIGNNTEVTILQIIASVIVIGLTAVSLYLFEETHKSAADKFEKNLMAQQMKYQKENYKNLELLQAETEKIRHDIKNHLQCIGNMIETGKHENATEYIKCVEKLESLNKEYISTDNIAINSLFNIKIMQAESKGIKVKHTVRVLPNIKIDTVDVGIIFGNALDNAIEACERIKEGDKWIEMSLLSKKGNLVFVIKNPTDGTLIKEYEYFKSSKRHDNKKHGLGLKNIKSAIENNCKGTVNWEHKNNIFELRFMVRHQNS